MKSTLRIEIKEKRDGMEEALRIECSEKIYEKLSTIDEFTPSRIIMFYVSFGSEVHTHHMIEQVLNTKRVLVPKVEDKEIIPTLILGMQNLIEGYAGILEPIDALQVKPKTIDMVVVPGIVFDKTGHRIGYSHGFYDKFLKKISHAVKVGLAFDFQVVDKFPSEEHDVPMDYIVTPEKVLKCR